MTERVVDVICLLLLIAGVFIFQHSAFEAIMSKFIFIPLEKLFIEGKSEIIYLLGAICVILIAISLWALKKIKKSFLGKKINLFLAQFKFGLLSITKLKNKGLFIFYTIFIWAGYFLMTFWWFSSLPSTSLLSWKAGFTLLVVGSLGKSIPIQGGGFGAYHYLISQTLIYFGVAAKFGFTLAVIIHGFQTLFYLITGSMAWLYLLIKKNKNLKVQEK